MRVKVTHCRAISREPPGFLHAVFKHEPAVAGTSLNIDGQLFLATGATHEITTEHERNHAPLEGMPDNNNNNYYYYYAAERRLHPNLKEK